MTAKATPKANARPVHFIPRVFHDRVDDSRLVRGLAKAHATAMAVYIELKYDARLDVSDVGCYAIVNTPEHWARDPAGVTCEVCLGWMAEQAEQLLQFPEGVSK